MVHDRRSHPPCELQTRERHFKKSKTADFEFWRDIVKRHIHTPPSQHGVLGCGKLFRNLTLLFFLLLLINVSAPAQAIYAENQIPARGVEIQYTVTVRNPVSHMYDIEM